MANKHRVSILFSGLLIILALFLFTSPTARLSARNPGKGKTKTEKEEKKEKEKKEKKEKEKKEKDKQEKSKLRSFESLHKKDKGKGKRKGWIKVKKDNDDNDDFWGDLLFDLVFSDGGFRYARYPYADPEQQGIFISRSPELAAYSHKPYGAQLQSFYQRVDNDTWSYNTEAKLRLPSSASFDIVFTKYVEKLKTKTVRMDYFAAYLNLGAFAVESNLIIDAGIGTAFLTVDNGESHGSLAHKLSLDYFPSEPWGIHLAGSYAAPSEKSLYNLDFHLGWYLKGLEIIAGYHALLNSDGENLDGPFLGIALWF